MPTYASFTGIALSTLLAVASVAPLLYFLIGKKWLAKRSAKAMFVQVRLIICDDSYARQNGGPGVAALCADIAHLQQKFGLTDQEIGANYSWELDTIMNVDLRKSAAIEVAPRSEDVDLDSVTISSAPKAFSQAERLALIEAAGLEPAAMVDDGWNMPRFALESDNPRSLRPLSLDDPNDGSAITMPSIAPAANTGFADADLPETHLPVRFVTIGDMQIPFGAGEEISEVDYILASALRKASAPPGAPEVD